MRHLCDYITAELSFKKGFRYEDLENGIGTLTLSCNEREYKVDSIKSYFEDKEDCTFVTVDFGEDYILYEDCKFDLTLEDMKSGDTKAKLYMGYTSDYFISGKLVYENEEEDFVIPLSLEE